MAKTKVSEWSSTAASNTDIDSINIAEGCAPSGINDAIRELMSQLKDFQQGTNGDSFNGPVNGTVGATTPAAGTFTTLATTGNTTLGNDSGDVITINGSTAFGAGAGITGNLTLSSGTANGVAYLNGSKVLTTGSALTFDGTNLGVGISTATAPSTIRTNGSYLTQDIVGDATNGWASIRYRNAANSATTVFFNYDNGAYKFGTVANEPIVFNVNNSEQMRLTSTGLGIGTSSPGERLTVQTALTGTTAGSNVVGRFQSNGNGYDANISLGDNNNAAARLGYLSGNMYFWTNGAERMRLDSSGNLGLGVTPSAWSSGKVLEIGNAGNAVWGNSTANFYITENAYYNGGWKYASSNGAATYQMLTNSHIWYTAPSGTAGNAISFTQAMTLDSSGNLLVGTTSAPTSSVKGWAVQPYASGCYVTSAINNTGSLTHYSFINPNGQVGHIDTNGSSTSYVTSSDYRLKENIAPMTGALAKVAALKPCTYKWKVDGSDGEGFIAHELAEVVPQCVTGEKDAVDENGNPVYQGIDTSFLVATLTAALQEAVAEINQLKADVAVLKGN